VSGLANPQRGVVAFQANGREYSLRFGTNELCAIEAFTGKPIAQMVAELQSTPSITTMRAMIAGGVRPSMSPAEAGDLIDMLGFDRIGELVGQALAVAFPERKDEPANPPKATA
jgi:hypothetical protein